jgi:hypothetical protein
MARRLDLPEGTQVGTLLSVTWGGSESSIVPGVYEGRVIGIKGNRVTLRFEYAGEPAETVVVNLDTGMDEIYHARVTDIQPVHRGTARALSR